VREGGPRDANQGRDTGQNRYVGVTFHDLRRANATALVHAGVDMKTAQARLGHSDPRLTLGVYAQPRAVQIATPQRHSESSFPPSARWTRDGNCLTRSQRPAKEALTCCFGGRDAGI